jgi:hypothetical protein
MTRFTIGLVLTMCLTICGTARAALEDYTGATYDWVAYNNLTATVGPAVPANITDFTIDTDPDRIYDPDGELLKYADGTGTGVTFDVEWDGSQLFVEDAYAPTPPTIFDVMGASYQGIMVIHWEYTYQLLTFTGLDPTKTYTFAGVATADTNHHDCLSIVHIQDVDASTQESVLTSHETLAGYAGYGMTDTSVSLSYVSDDLAMWSGINPGADGAFSILVDGNQRGSRDWCPAFDAIALAQEGDGGTPPRIGDFDGDGDIDVDDIDAIAAAMQAGSTDLTFDLDGDGDVDFDDFAFHVQNLADTSTSYFDEPSGTWMMTGTELGDFNLDGTVGLLDLARLGEGWSSSDGWLWGDANGDGTVGLLDLARLGENWGYDRSAIPEPASATVLLMGALMVLKRNRR